MFGSKPADKSEDLLANSNIEDLRAERVWRLLNVGSMTWLFFTLYMAVRGYVLATTICLSEVVVLFMITRYCRNRNEYTRGMNLSLAACAVGLLAVATNHPALSATMLFFPASIVIASQLVGIRSAFQWLLACIAATILFHLHTCGLEGMLTHRVDQFTMALVSSICIFFCCHQGEAYYRERTRELIALSQQLERKSKELQQLAITDSLTGLTNRHEFHEELGRRASHSTLSGEPTTLLVIDMDGFKAVNDTMGHPVGDAALVEIANRLQLEFSSTAKVSRFGGDEFCIILPGIGSAAEAQLAAEKACSILTDRYVFDETEFPLGASIGIAVCPDDAANVTDWFAFADTAMFHAKENRLGFARYVPEMTTRLVDQLAMQERLASAVENSEFYLAYQPQVSVRTGAIVGVEALLRWKSNGEVIKPSTFISLLEKNREIVTVGKWIIREACRQQREWKNAGYDIGISINVSSLQFSDTSFYSSVLDPVIEFDVDPTKLDFEVTETLLIEDVSTAVDKLNQLKELGATVSIDDFGTGYSSLAYLRQLPIDRLKIDHAFVSDIPDKDDGIIATSIVGLAKDLSVKVVAEGVRSAEQLAFLRQVDCDEYQGYFFSRPVSPREVELLLDDNQEHQQHNAPTPISKS